METIQLEGLPSTSHSFLEGVLGFLLEGVTNRHSAGPGPTYSRSRIAAPQTLEGGGRGRKEGRSV